MLDDAPGALGGTRTDERLRATEEEAWLLCTTCERRITRVASRTRFDGGHTHTFSNPHGFSFDIALFDDAPGCTLDGEATEYFSWFPGYGWRIASCAGCRAHLGWGFECIGPPGPGEPAGFYGLIAGRLMPGG